MPQQHPLSIDLLQQHVSSAPHLQQNKNNNNPLSALSTSRRTQSIHALQIQMEHLKHEKQWLLHYHALLFLQSLTKSETDAIEHAFCRQWTCHVSFAALPTFLASVGIAVPSSSSSTFSKNPPNPPTTAGGVKDGEGDSGSSTAAASLLRIVLDRAWQRVQLHPMICHHAPPLSQLLGSHPSDVVSAQHPLSWPSLIKQQSFLIGDAFSLLMQIEETLEGVQQQLHSMQWRHAGMLSARRATINAQNAAQLLSQKHRRGSSANTFIPVALRSGHQQQQQGGGASVHPRPSSAAVVPTAATGGGTALNAPAASFHRPPPPEPSLLLRDLNVTAKVMDLVPTASLSLDTVLWVCRLLKCDALLTQYHTSTLQGGSMMTEVGVVSSADGRGEGCQLGDEEVTVDFLCLFQSGAGVTKTVKRGRNGAQGSAAEAAEVFSTCVELAMEAAAAAALCDAGTPGGSSMLYRSETTVVDSSAAPGFLSGGEAEQMDAVGAEEALQNQFQLPLHIVDILQQQQRLDKEQERALQRWRRQQRNHHHDGGDHYGDESSSSLEESSSSDGETMNGAAPSQQPGGRPLTAPPSSHNNSAQAARPSSSSSATRMLRAPFVVAKRDFVRCFSASTSSTSRHPHFSLKQHASESSSSPIATAASRGGGVAAPSERVFSALHALRTFRGEDDDDVDHYETYLSTVASSNVSEAGGGGGGVIRSSAASRYHHPHRNVQFTAMATATAITPAAGATSASSPALLPPPLLHRKGSAMEGDLAAAVTTQPGSGLSSAGGGATTAAAAATGSRGGSLHRGHLRPDSHRATSTAASVAAPAGGGGGGGGTASPHVGIRNHYHAAPLDVLFPLKGMTWASSPSASAAATGGSHSTSLNRRPSSSSHRPSSSPAHAADKLSLSSSSPLPNRKQGEEGAADEERESLEQQQQQEEDVHERLRPHRQSAASSLRELYAKLQRLEKQSGGEGSPSPLSRRQPPPRQRR